MKNEYLEATLRTLGNMWEAVAPVVYTVVFVLFVGFLVFHPVVLLAIFAALVIGITVATFREHLEEVREEREKDAE